MFPCYTKEKGEIQMTAEYKNWQEEFVDINFTDQRLKSRFFKIIDAFAASPGKSTWAATGSRSSAKAAYRFFSNSEISKDELLDSISRATVEKIKCADAEWILAVQDTTAVGFGDRKAIQGMGYLIWEFLEGRKVLRAMVCPEYVLSGKDWMYYIHCLLIEIILYKYGSS
jgi:hypothetical protein